MKALKLETRSLQRTFAEIAGEVNFYLHPTLE